MIQTSFDSYSPLAYDKTLMKMAILPFFAKNGAILQHQAHNFV